MVSAKEAWASTEPAREAAGIKPKAWKRSYDGITLVLAAIGYVLDMSPAELTAAMVTARMPSQAKVVVTRNERRSDPTALTDLLSGHSSLLTPAEMAAVHANRIRGQSARLPKGVATLNHQETKAANDLFDIIGASACLTVEHLWEFRAADVALALLGTPLSAAAFAALQIKSSAASGALAFQHGGGGKSLTVGAMRNMLSAGMSILCIGLAPATKCPSRAWFFFGDQALKMFASFGDEQHFQPRLHLKRMSFDAFTVAYNTDEFSYDLRPDATGAPRRRLLDTIILSVEQAPKHSVAFYNENESQLSGTHITELRGFALQRDALEVIGSSMVKLFADNHGPVDSRIDPAGFNCRKQDKTIGAGSTLQITIRQTGGMPLNPNSVDMLTVTLLSTSYVYAIPMRYVDEHGKVQSTFSSAELMNTVIYLSEKWLSRFAQYLCDLNKEGARKLWRIAEAAAAVGPSDQMFFDEMVAAGRAAGKIGSPRELKAFKAAAEAE